MVDRALLLVLAAIVTVLTLVSVAGHGPTSGSTVLTLTATHGVDEGDLPVAALWVVAMGCLAAVWRRLR